MEEAVEVINDQINDNNNANNNEIQNKNDEENEENIAPLTFNKYSKNEYKKENIIDNEIIKK